MNKIVPFKHPTTVLIIDDDTELLQEMEIFLSKHFIIKAFHNPHSLIKYIEQYANSHEDSKQRSFEIEEDVFEQIKKINVDVNSVYKEVLNPDRFSQISAIIADNNMPKMMGLDLLRKVKLQNIQKILLTGYSSDCAIDAFNDGTIHFFIEKGQLDTNKKIIEFLKKSEEKLFTNKTISLNGILDDGLEGKDLSNHFYEIFQAYGIVEYYLLDQNGTFVGLCRDGSAYFIFIQNQSFLNTIIREIGDDSILSEKMLKSIRSKEKMICWSWHKQNPFPTNLNDCIIDCKKHTNNYSIGITNKNIIPNFVLPNVLTLDMYVDFKKQKNDDLG